MADRLSAVCPDCGSERWDDIRYLLWDSGRKCAPCGNTDFHRKPVADDMSATFDKDQLPEDVEDPADLQGLTVLINGMKYRVRAVERWAVPYPRRMSFGLLV